MVFDRLFVGSDRLSRPMAKGKSGRRAKPRCERERASFGATPKPKELGPAVAWKPRFKPQNVLQKASDKAIKRMKELEKNISKRLEGLRDDQRYKFSEANCHAKARSGARAGGVWCFMEGQDTELESKVMKQWEIAEFSGVSEVPVLIPVAELQSIIGHPTDDVVVEHSEEKNVIVVMLGTNAGHVDPEFEYAMCNDVDNHKIPSMRR